MEKDGIVRKHNALARAQWQPATIMEGRLLAATLAQISPADEDFREYVVDVAQIVSDPAALGGRRSKQVARAVREAQRRQITFRDGRQEIHASLFSHVRYVYGERKVYVSFDPILKPYYLQLKKHYTEYSLLEFVQLRSTYSQRLFEYLASWNEKDEIVVPIEELHELMQIPDSYRKSYVDFRKRILDQAHKEITSETSLKYEWEPIRYKRKIVAIRFIFSRKKVEAKKAEKREKKEQKERQNSSKRHNEIFLAAVNCYNACGQSCKRDKSPDVCSICERLIRPRSSK
jgi:plasmid replication initiation protein